MADGWERAARARREFADLVEGLDEQQLDGPTPCGQWTPRHILGHLVSFVDQGLGSFFGNLLKHRFDYNRAADTQARAFATRPVDDLVATLRANAAKKAWLPVFPEELTVTDAVIHTQDVRRGVGLDGRPDDETLRLVLDFVTGHKQARNIGGPSLKDLSFRATDLEWSSGSGPTVEGPAESLMMAMAGRPVLDELSGDGVERLRR